MKEKDIIYNRTKELSDKLNTFLKSITGVEKNYFEELPANELIGLKSALSDINNVLTLKTTLVFSNWIADYFGLTPKERETMIIDVNGTSPNANGFDIKVEGHNILAEIKCIVPIKGKTTYVAGQKNSILNDAIKLENKTKKPINKNDYYKFIGFLDFGEGTDHAIDSLTAEYKITSSDVTRIKRRDVVDRLEVLKDDISYKDLDKTKIYLKKIKID